MSPGVPLTATLRHVCEFFSRSHKDLSLGTGIFRSRLHSGDELVVFDFYGSGKIVMALAGSANCQNAKMPFRHALFVSTVKSVSMSAARQASAFDGSASCFAKAEKFMKGWRTDLTISVAAIRTSIGIGPSMSEGYVKMNIPVRQPFELSVTAPATVLSRVTVSVFPPPIGVGITSTLSESIPSCLRPCLPKLQPSRGQHVAPMSRQSR